MKKISIVVPVYNEELNIREFHKKISEALACVNYEYQIIFIDDGSRDKTAEILTGLAASDRRVEAYVLSRNYGHQLALTCGLDNADGDAVITMDGDLQHPPRLVPELIRLWEQGYDIVQTRRIATEDASLLKKATSKVYYNLMNLVSDVSITPGGSDFRLMDRMAVDALKMYRERARFIRGLVNTLGFNVCVVDFVAPSRFAGTSKFSLRKMLKFAMDGITAFSNLPLRWAFYAGFVAVLAGFAIFGHVLYLSYLVTEKTPSSIIVLASVLLLGGVQLIGIGVLGEYIGRIFDEVKRRPLYLVARHVSGNKNGTAK